MVYPKPTTTPLIFTRSMGWDYQAKRQRDAQRSKAYKFERSFFDRSEMFEQSMSKEESRNFINKVFSDHGLPAPRVNFRDANTCHFSLKYDKEPVLSLASWGQNEQTILHEVAHGINFYADYNRAGHGAEWMRIYVDIVEKYRGISMYTPARDAGLQIAPAERRTDSSIDDDILNMDVSFLDAEIAGLVCPF